MHQLEIQNAFTMAKHHHWKNNGKNENNSVTIVTPKYTKNSPKIIATCIEKVEIHKSTAVTPAHADSGEVKILFVWVPLKILMSRFKNLYTVYITYDRPHVRAQLESYYPHRKAQCAHVL